MKYIIPEISIANFGNYVCGMMLDVQVHYLIPCAFLLKTFQPRVSATQTGGWKDTFVNDQICSFVAVSGKNSIHCSIRDV